MPAHRWIVGVSVATALLVSIGACTQETGSQPTDEAAIEATTETPTDTSPDTAQVTALQLLAHRGVHQTFPSDDLTDETCTAEIIHAPVHEYLENTIPSMAAAFDAGAAVVEIDIAPTADGVLVVFHDWTVDCRTESSGPIRDLTLNEVSELDIGYGYTSDGTTFPFRGTGVGLMPTLEEVFTEFPNGRFLINFKSGDVAEAELLHDLVERTDASDQIWAVYGAHDTVAEYRELSGARGFSDVTVATCLVQYSGGADAVPPECQDTIILLPFEAAQLRPEGPVEFAARLAGSGTVLIVSGDQNTGIDTVQAFENLPDDLEAYVWTNRIDVLGAGVN